MKRINWGLLLKGFCWVVSLSGLIVLMGFVEVKKSEAVCADVKILIPGADNFIEREEITSILRQNFGELRNTPISQINTHQIEREIRDNPYIAAVKVYADMDGVVRIKVKQRQPVLRIINSGNQDYYLDNEGNKMPVSANFTANVLVATGNIKEGFTGRVEKFSSPLVRDLYKTAMFIRQDTLWDAQIEQLYVDERQELELIPRVGFQRILLGDASELDVKMNNLLIFYKKAMPKVGWDTYKTINVKYTNQIVCERNKLDSNAVNSIVIAADTVKSQVATDQEFVVDVEEAAKPAPASVKESVQKSADVVNKIAVPVVKKPQTKQVSSPTSATAASSASTKESSAPAKKKQEASKNKTQ